jgi:uncharacterized protein
MPKIKFDCADCLAFCCSIYERVHVTDSDLKRLATYSNKTTEEAAKFFTKIKNGERILRRRKDEKLGEACKFLDAETRMCTIYEGRPQACRDWPDSNRCVYYDMLKFERNLQESHDVVPVIKMTVYYHDDE